MQALGAVCCLHVDCIIRLSLPLLSCLFITWPSDGLGNTVQPVFSDRAVTRRGYSRLTRARPSVYPSVCSRLNVLLL